jgi:hypothetical protein
MADIADRNFGRRNVCGLKRRAANRGRRRKRTWHGFQAVGIQNRNAGQIDRIAGRLIEGRSGRRGR